MKFKLHNEQTRQAAIEYIQKLPDRLFTVTVEKTRTTRSIDQNALYWLWLTCIADETGADKDEIHREMRMTYLPHEIVQGIHGEFIERPISTTKLDTAQFKQYLDKIQVFASAELGIVLPSPEDRAFEAFNEYYKNRL